MDGRTPFCFTVPFLVPAIPSTMATTKSRGFNASGSSSPSSSSETTPLLKAIATVSTEEVDEEEQDEDGLAPVENVNPLGKEVNLLTAFMLNIGQITGCVQPCQIRSPPYAVYRT